MAASQAELARIRANEDLKFLYLPDPSETGDDDGNLPKIGSAFFRSFKKVFWHSSTQIRPDVETTRKSDKNENEKTTTISYKISTSSTEETLRSGKTCHRYLYLTTGKFYFPGVKVKPEHQESVRISWSKDGGVYYCIESLLKIGDMILDSFGSTWIDDYRGWNRNSINDVTYNESVLNIPIMTQWNSELPAKTATYTLPHFYSYSPGSAFPLFLVDNNVKISHELKIPTNVEEKLLRVQVTENGSDWEDVEFNDVKSFLEISSQSTPSLLCDTFDISPEEGEDNRKENSIVIPIQKVIHVQTENTTQDGETSSLNINTDSPVVALFFKGVNTESEKYNNHGNCTNMLDEDDLNSVSSISTGFCKYNLIDKFSYTPEEMRSDRMLNFFPSIPNRKGRFAHSFCMKPFDPNKLSGVVLDGEMKAVLFCKMVGKKSENDRKQPVFRNEDVISDLIARKKSKRDETTDIKSSHYRTVVSLLTHSDLIFTKNEKGFYDINCK
jgi:hypothetical protein